MISKGKVRFKLGILLNSLIGVGVDSLVELIFTFELVKLVSWSVEIFELEETVEMTLL